MAVLLLHILPHFQCFICFGQEGLLQNPGVCLEASAPSLDLSSPTPPFFLLKLLIGAILTDSNSNSDRFKFFKTRWPTLAGELWSQNNAFCEVFETRETISPCSTDKKYSTVPCEESVM